MPIAAGTGYLICTRGLYTAGSWIPDPSFPEVELLPATTGTPVSGSYTVTSVGYFSLFDGTDWLPFHRLGEIPNGFQVNSIQQLLNGTPANPQPGGAESFLISPFTAKNAGAAISGGWLDTTWDIPEVGLSNASPVFVPATQGMLFLGPWNLTQDFDQFVILSGSPTATGLRVGGTTAPVNVFGDPIQGISGSTPVVAFAFSWSYDTDACAGVTPVTGATVTDPVTGAISWSVPVSADGTIVEVENSVGDIETVYLDNAITTYTPTLSGNLTIRLYAATLFPICKSSVVTLSVTVTTPFVFTMGEDGITTGIFLGGTSTLQFIGNPSGIYTIVPGKAYDTLYERIPAVTSQNVKIPDPFITTAYVGE